jgi:hypothetical protein
MDKMLPSYAPFRSQPPGEEGELVCDIQVQTKPLEVDIASATFLSEVNKMELGSLYRLYETEEGYIIDIRYADDGKWYQMCTDKHFKHSVIYLDLSDEWVGNTLNSFIMFAFAQTVVLYRTILIHASVVEDGSAGFAFLGKSGTGKSTHASLWIKYIQNIKLLNDDNPAIRIKEDNCIYIYGTPWSGKTPCYRNKKTELKALVRLMQSPANEYFPLHDYEAFINVLPSCSSMRWSKELYTALCDDVEILISKTTVARLACRPDREAAVLCYNEINGKINNNLIK